ncbi:MAG TPA: hypothetical protein VE666_09125 [Mycobacterium sp.]|nr:hypothetical protein [Mycobacterium sp.]
MRVLGHVERGKTVVIGELGRCGRGDAAVAGEKYEPVVHPRIRTCSSPAGKGGVPSTCQPASEYLDDGVYGSYSSVITEDVHPPILALRELTGDVVANDAVTLAGPTCDSADVIAREYPMPYLEVGDVVVSPMMGAYTVVTASRFNDSRPPDLDVLGV